MSSAHAAPSTAAAVSDLQLTVVSRAWPPLVHVRIRLPSGAFSDPTGREGQAALCWRAAIRAAGGRSQAQLARALDALGATLDVRVGRQDTLIEGTTLASQLKPFMALLADAVLKPRLNASDIDHARARQLADIAARFDDDEALAHEGLVRFAHRKDAAGRPADGDATSLATITAAHCRAYHHAVIAGVTPRFGFAGAIDQTAAATLVRASFGPLVGSRAPLSFAANRPLVAPVVAGRRLLLLDHPGRKQASIMLGFPTVGSTHPDLLALRLADAVIGGAFTSRLNLRIREQRGWTYSLQSFVRASPKSGMWTIGWTPGHKVAARSIDLAMRIVELACKDGISAAEATFGRGYLDGAARYDADTAEAELDLRLHAIALGLGPQWLDHYPKRVAALTHKQASAALRAHIHPGKVVAVVVGDAKKLLPALKGAKAGFAIQVLPYRVPANTATVVGKTISTTPGPSSSPLETTPQPGQPTGPSPNATPPMTSTPLP